MKHVFVSILFLTVGYQAVFSQDKEEQKYKERGIEVQDEIWGNAVKAFAVSEIPDEYKDESAVIIGRFFEVTNSSRVHYRFNLFGGSLSKRYRYFTTLRERVKINDKAALDEFSTLEYKKNLNRTTSVFLSKMMDSYKSFVGAKVIKPDGKQVIVNADEEVLTKNESKEKEGKLAIPGLQVGDILDYYVRIEEITDQNYSARGPNYFLLADDHPILYYNVRYILDRRCGADVLNVNGAKPMVISRTDDNDLQAEFTETNLPAYKNTLWVSYPRQFPYYAVRYSFAESDTHFAAGRINTENPFEKFIRDIRVDYGRMRTAGMMDYKPAEKAMIEYFDGKRNMEEMPGDSLAAFLYNFYRWQIYGSFDLDDIDAGNDRNYRSMNKFYVTTLISEILNRFDVNNEIVMASSRFSNRLKEAITRNDVEMLVKVNNGGKSTYYGMTDFFSLPGELPAVYQGEDAVSWQRGGRRDKPNFDDMDIKLPVAPCTANVLKEDLKVSFDAANLQTLKIDRTCKLTGSMKQGDQKSMLLAEDVEASLARNIGKDKKVDILMESKKTKAKGEELQAAFNKERARQKDYFKDEIKGQFEEEPKDISVYEIIKDGLTLKNPAFEYRAVFTMDNFVKKAGPNFIFDIGRLMGVYKKVDEDERARKIDVYMPSARILEYNFTVSLPQGYTAKGIEQLNKTVSNESGSFVSTAKQTGNDIAVTATRTYKSNFEKAENWKKLLDIMDAAADFTALKLLLEKQK